MLRNLTILILVFFSLFVLASCKNSNSLEEDKNNLSDSHVKEKIGQPVVISDIPPTDQIGPPLGPNDQPIPIPLTRDLPFRSSQGALKSAKTGNKDVDDDSDNPIVEDICETNFLPQNNRDLLNYCDRTPLVETPNITGLDLPGDGLVPMLTEDRTRLFLAFHHSDPGQNSLFCYELPNLGACAGYPQTFPMGGVDSYIAGSGGAIVVQDKIYLNAYNSIDNFGISCWDMKLDTPCGYIQLGPTGGKVALDLVSDEKSGSSMPGQVGTKLYTLDRQMQLHCVGLDLSPCGGPYPIDLNTMYGLPTLNNIGLFSQGLYTEVLEDKVYFSIIGDSDSKAFCWDTTNDTACQNWTNPTPTFSFHDKETKLATYIAFDTDAQPVGFCRDGHSCIRLSDGIVDDSLVPASWVSSLYTQEDTYLNTNGEMLTIFAQWVVDPSFVYNWTTKQIFIYQREGSQNYGAFVDEAGCAWWGGHTNIIWQLQLDNLPNPNNDHMAEERGCPGFSAADTIKPFDYSCSPGVLWDKIEIFDLNTNQFNSLELSIFDKQNNQIGNSINLLIQQIVDISGPLYAQENILKYVINGEPNQEILDTPFAEFSFQALSPEVCCTEPPLKTSNCD